jgi:hypothetical protein
VKTYISTITGTFSHAPESSLHGRPPGVPQRLQQPLRQPGRRGSLISASRTVYTTCSNLENPFGAGERAFTPLSIGSYAAYNAYPHVLVGRIRRVRQTEDVGSGRSPEIHTGVFHDDDSRRLVAAYAIRRTDLGDVGSK